MSSASETPPRIIWKDASDVVGPLPIAGAAGGVLPGGALSLTLYSERLTLPEEVELHRQEGEADTSFREVPVGSAGVLTRTNHAHLILNPSVARQIAEWLMERAQEAEKTIATD